MQIGVSIVTETVSEYISLQEENIWVETAEQKFSYLTSDIKAICSTESFYRQQLGRAQDFRKKVSCQVERCSLRKCLFWATSAFPGFNPSANVNSYSSLWILLKPFLQPWLYPGFFALTRIIMGNTTTLDDAKMTRRGHMVIWLGYAKNCAQTHRTHRAPNMY